MSKMTTDNYRKHTHQNPVQKYLIERFYVAFIEEIKKRNPKTVLDVGCGEGFTLERLRKQNIGEKLEGIDFLKTAIEIGKKDHPKLILKVASAYDLPYQDNSFDLLICSEVLEHLDDPKKALDEIHRVTRKYAVLSVPNEPTFMISNFLRGKNWSRWGNDIEHINHWSTNSFKKFVEAKFEVVAIRRPFPWTLLVVEKKN
jgi:ubiquinone/menaquinone biosynthesis C-methylase UbiE